MIKTDTVVMAGMLFLNVGLKKGPLTPETGRSEKIRQKPVCGLYRKGHCQGRGLEAGYCLLRLQTHMWGGKCGRGEGARKAQEVPGVRQ